MKYYNLYYKDTKINNRPITENDLLKIKEVKNIVKHNNITGKLENIPTDKIRPIKTIII